MAVDAQDNPEGAPRLSARQWQILRCLIKGHHNKTIAHQLGIEVVTVKMHIGILFKKLGVTNRTEAAVRGIALCRDSVDEPGAEAARDPRLTPCAHRAPQRRWHGRVQGPVAAASSAPRIGTERS
jgi:DNA-binding CsgD family transcriptional regulator